MADIDFVMCEDDGVAWYERGRIVINLRWVNFEDEVEEYIDTAFIHEYVEHILGLGHETALQVEKLLKPSHTPKTKHQP